MRFRSPRTTFVALTLGAGALLAGCGFTPGGGPAPSGTSCIGTPVEGHIRSAFAGTGDEDWALRIAYRESRCNPGARNPSGAVGLFQLVNHNDLLWAACPYVYDSGTRPDCNAKAARMLYNSAGRSPWGG
jgi:soluble lytic murein transglycosylase-like protein